MTAPMCRHNRQLTVCAICAPEAERHFAATGTQYEGIRAGDVIQVNGTDIVLGGLLLYVERVEPWGYLAFQPQRNAAREYVRIARGEATRVARAPWMPVDALDT